MRTYSELIKLKTFDERLNYLKCNGKIGIETFGHGRYLNQEFYSSREWKLAKTRVIARDLGCDMGLEGYDIYGQIIVHHMNPLTIDDFENGSDQLFNPEYLVCVCRKTHDAIHYGSKITDPLMPLVERKPNDTCPWKEV